MIASTDVARTFARAQARVPWRRAALTALGLALGFAVAVGLALLLAGCAASALDRATVAANAAHDLEAASAEVLHVACTVPYGAAKTPADVAALDVYCLPAGRALAALRAARLATALAITSGSADDATLARLGAETAAAGVTLGRAMAVVPRKESTR